MLPGVISLVVYLVVSPIVSLDVFPIVSLVVSLVLAGRFLFRAEPGVDACPTSEAYPLLNKHLIKRKYIEFKNGVGGNSLVQIRKRTYLFS